MDFKQIQELIKLVNDSNIGEVTIEQKEFRVTIKQKEEQVTQMVAAPMQTPLFTSAPQQQLSAPAPAQGQEKPKQESAAPSNTITIKSPMIGANLREL